MEDSLDILEEFSEEFLRDDVDVEYVLHGGEGRSDQILVPVFDKPDLLLHGIETCQ